MIEYEELCAALDRFVARTGGMPSSRAPSPGQPQPGAPRAPLAMTTSPTRTAAPAPAPYEPPTGEVELPPLAHHDEAHDPDYGALAGEHNDDATHVGSSPNPAPPPLAPAHDHDHDEHSNEIDIGDVLSDDEL